MARFCSHQNNSVLMKITWEMFKLDIGRLLPCFLFLGIMILGLFSLSNKELP